MTTTDVNVCRSTRQSRWKRFTTISRKESIPFCRSSFPPPFSPRFFAYILFLICLSLRLALLLPARIHERATTNEEQRTRARERGKMKKDAMQNHSNAIIRSTSHSITPDHTLSNQQKITPRVVGERIDVESKRSNEERTAGVGGGERKGMRR